MGKMKTPEEPSYAELPLARGVPGEPDCGFELVNRFGTYDVQPTGKTGNHYPSDARPLPAHRRDTQEDAGPSPNDVDSAV